MKNFNPTKTVFVSVLFALSVILFSCDKEESGPPGKDGVANLSTHTFTTNSNDWLADNANNLMVYQQNIPEITQEVIENGAVLAYFGDGSGDIWIAMPFSSLGLEFVFGYYESNVEIIVSLANGQMPNNPGGQEFKIVIIPPAQRISNINHQNYEEVRMAYGLKD